jgi:glutaredoxin
MTDIIIYTLKVCPNCKLVKDVLIERKIPFEEMDLEMPESLTKMLMNSVAPVLQIGDVFLTYDTLFKNGELDIEILNNALL